MTQKEDRLKKISDDLELVKFYEWLVDQRLAKEGLNPTRIVKEYRDKNEYYY